MILLLLAASAGATEYFCDLDDETVEDIIEYYEFGFTVEDAQQELATFDCDNHGDLCGLVGPGRAEAFVCSRWSDLASHVSESTFSANAEADLEAKIDDREDEAFPYGIPTDDYYWYAPPTAGCSYPRVDEDDYGSKRLRGNSFFHRRHRLPSHRLDVALVREVGWTVPQGVGECRCQLLVVGNGRSLLRHWLQERYSTDGFVSIRKWGTPGTLVPEKVVTYHSGSSTSTNTCRETWAWSCI